MNDLAPEEFFDAVILVEHGLLIPFFTLMAIAVVVMIAGRQRKKPESSSEELQEPYISQWERQDFHRRNDNMGPPLNTWAYPDDCDK